MRSAILTAFAVSALCPATLVAQDDPSPVTGEEVSQAKLTIAQEIIDLGFPADIREELFFAANDQTEMQIRDAMLKSLPAQDEGAIAILNDWIAENNARGKVILRRHIPLLIDGMAKSYAVVFTQQELMDIRAFVSTPSGQRFFELSSAILAEPNFAMANQAYMDEAFADLPSAQEELVARLQEYFATKGEGMDAEDEIG